MPTAVPRRQTASERTEPDHDDPTPPMMASDTPRPASDPTPSTLGSSPDDEPSRRERAAALLEERLDIPMAILAVVWAALVAYELVAPARQTDGLALAGNVIWVVFLVEFAVKITVSGHPVRFLRRRWPAVLFLALPALRVFRVLRAVRALRVLPAARVMGSSYRAIGTARTLLGSRLAFLSVMSGVVIFAGGQLFHLAEGQIGDAGSLGDGIWWAANAAISGNLVVEPVTVWGRLLGLFLQGYAVVVFASVAATLGAFFIESRAERAAAEDDEHDRRSAAADATA
ncbi:MAG: ion transporter [Acidimicrobiales bacterium]